MLGKFVQQINFRTAILTRELSEWGEDLVSTFGASSHRRNIVHKSDNLKSTQQHTPLKRHAIVDSPAYFQTGTDLDGPNYRGGFAGANWRLHFEAFTFSTPNCSSSFSYDSPSTLTYE